MAEPDSLPIWDENNVRTLDYGTSREDDGWEVDALDKPEKPQVEHFNFWQRLVYKWVEWLNTEKNRIDSEKLAKASNLGDLVSKPASRANLDVYSTLEITNALALKMTRSQNLDDVGSKSTARANLSLYSKTEVDALIAGVISGGWGNWVNMTYLNDWEANTSLGNKALRYRVSLDGQNIQIGGTLRNPTSAVSLSTIATLPTIYVPEGSYPIYCTKASSIETANLVIQGEGQSSPGNLNITNHEANTTYYINQIIPLD